MKKNLTHLYYKNTKEFANTNSGITLIALVVTIIVLLILVGVTLDLVSGSNGILKKARNSADTSKIESAKEQIELKLAEYQTEFYESVYVNRTADVNKNMGDWIAEKTKGKSIETEDYTFEITGDKAPYTVTIKKDNTLKLSIKGELNEDGTLSFPSSESGGTTDETIYQETDVSYFTFELVNDSNSTYCYNNNYDGYVITGLSETGITAAQNGELENITLPSTYEGQPIVSIGEWATEDETWSYVKKIVVPSSIKSIDSYSLACVNAYGTKILFQEGLENIEDQAFRGYNNVPTAYIKLPDSVKYLGEINDSYTDFTICVGKNIEELSDSWGYYYSPSKNRILFFDGTIEELNSTSGFSSKIEYFYQRGENERTWKFNVVYCLSDNKFAMQENPTTVSSGAGRLLWEEIDLDNYISSHVDDEAISSNKESFAFVLERGKINFGGAPESVVSEESEKDFVWASNDPNLLDYYTLVGYKSNVQNYPVLSYPKRCKKIVNPFEDWNYEKYQYDDLKDDQLRSYLNGITEIVIPDTVRELGDYAFKYNDSYYLFRSLEKVTIPASVTSIGYGAFYGCTKLKEIIIESGSPLKESNAYYWGIDTSKVTITRE